MATFADNKCVFERNPSGTDSIIYLFAQLTKTNQQFG